MPLWLAAVLLALAASGIVLCRKYRCGNKTAYILCILFCSLLALACISEAACFYGIYFGWYGWSGLVFPTLVTLVPPLVFALGSGWLLGMLRPWLLYVWMLVSPVCLALPLPESLGLWNGRLFAQYPLTLGTLDPAFTLPAAVLFVQFVLLASGVVLLAVRPEGQRQH